MILQPRGNHFHGIGTVLMSAVQGVPTSTDQWVKCMVQLKVAELIGDKGISTSTLVRHHQPFPLLCSLKLINHIAYHQFHTMITSCGKQHVFLTGRVHRHPICFMQHFFRTLDDGIKKSQVLNLFFIDLSPNNHTCTCSALLDMHDQSGKLNQQSAPLTFDQPLWQKAVEILEAKSLNWVVCQLCHFHLLVSAYGSDGNIMMSSLLS